MKIKWVVAAAVGAGFLACAGGLILAETATTDYKKEIVDDKAAIKAAKGELKKSATLNKLEEKQLLDQIAAAEESGNETLAKSLKAQYKAMHKDNVQDRKADKKGLKEAKHELTADKKAAKAAAKASK